MKLLLAALFIIFSSLSAQATNYCGQTISGYVTLDSDQNCVNEGIRLNPNATLDGAGIYHVYGYSLPVDKACIRGLNSTAIGTSMKITNVFIEGCGEGINFDNVRNPRVDYSTITKTRGSAGVRCAKCVNGVMHHNYISFNTANGILFQGSSQNSVYNNTITGNGTGVRVSALSSLTSKYIRLYDNLIAYNPPGAWSVVFDGNTNNSYTNVFHLGQGWNVDRVIFTNGTFGNLAKGYNYCQDDSNKRQCQ